MDPRVTCSSVSIYPTNPQFIPEFRPEFSPDHIELTKIFQKIPFWFKENDYIQKLHILKSQLYVVLDGIRGCFRMRDFFLQTR